MYFNNYKKNSVIIVSLFILAFTFGRASVYLRHTDYRILYHISWSGCYLLHFLSLLSSVINTMYTLRVVDFKDYKKYYWLLVNCIPIYFWAYIFLEVIYL